jgi:phosphopantothenoylcysteine decarboxylase/phosphopantothenate--cysteine ligase
MQILITAGPTREYLDDVRYLSNASSGRMGYALAAAALQRDHAVTLVSGPIALEPPPGARLVRVESAGEMLDACLGALPHVDGVIGVAAVCDYQVRRRVPGKIKKTGAPLSLELVETPDVLAELGRRKDGRWILGFALETSDDRSAALEKLRSKNCDWIVLNRAEAIGSDTTAIEVIDPRGQSLFSASGSKPRVAEKLLDWLGERVES